jgi:AraC family transcriptional regulator
MTIAGTHSMSGEFAATRVFYPAGQYDHSPAGLLQLRVVRRGSSYARIDLGHGLCQVFTRPGDLLLSLPDRPTMFHIDDGRELTLLQAAPEIVATILAESGASISELYPLAQRPFRDPLIAEICRRMETAEFAEAPLGAQALTLVIGLLLACARKQVRARAHVLSERRLAAVIRCIDDAGNDTITVEQLAGIAGMPARKFSAAFREATGLPVYQYVLRRRSERARDLLTSSDLRLSEIAQRTGFSHQSHMNRVIKRLLGRTPAQIRNDAD